MSTATPETPDTKRHAKLVRGRIYFYGDIEFRADGPPLPVTAEQEKHLKQHATDQITLAGENEFELRQKFNFGTLAELNAADERARQRQDDQASSASARRSRQRG